MDKYFEILDQHSKSIQWYQKETLGWPDKIYTQLWGDDINKEEAYFIKISELVETHQNQILEISNKIKIQEAMKFEQHIFTELPEELKPFVEESDQSMEPESTDLSTLYKLIKFDYRELSIEKTENL